MATHDYSIANATGAAFRADLNAALLAIATTNTSSVAPTVPYAGMLWTDLSGGGDGIVRRRNAANTAWLSDIGIDSTARAAAAAAQTTADAALPKAGGTMTGQITLTSATPTGLQPVHRTYADATYQLKLLTPIAGSLLVGTAAGWASKVDPGAANSVLAVVGGLPTWQLTAQSASANAIVRALADGTIDPSFIPAVASGLKYRGTFKPAVNAEYPTTGGTGAGNVPATGDFWVIDGLTTGGYTYLTGSLAGVTVYNGDSIAYTGSTWYRMGSSVQLQGYLKIDGSVAMTGNLNMGTQSIVEIGGLTARAGNAVPMSNFVLDTTNVLISPQRGTSGADLSAMTAGRLGTDLGRMQIYVGVGASNQPMLPIRWHTQYETYAAGDYVRYSGRQYRAPSTIAAGPFTASQWQQIVDTGGAQFTGNLLHASTSNVQFFRADGTPVSILVYDTASDSLMIQRRGADGSNIENALQISPTTGLTLRTVTFANAATFNSSGTFTGAARIKQNLEFVRTDNSNSLIITHDAANNYVRFSVRDAAGAGVYDAIQMSQANCTIRRLTCPDSGIVFGSATLPSTAGNAVNALHLYAKSVNNDQLNFLLRRTAAGSAWDTAAWGISRTVDGTGQSSIEFGPTSENVAFSVWSAAGRSIVVANTTGVVTTISNITSGGAVSPLADGANSCGGPANRWTTVYAVNGSINTSDAREKSGVTPFSPEELSAAPPIMDALGRYNWRPELGRDTLYHYGMTAQDVETILADAGVDPSVLGVVIHDQWEATEDTEAGDRYSLNYTELFALCLSSLNARVRALESPQPATEF